MPEAAPAQERPSFQPVDPASGEAGPHYEGHTPDEALGLARAARAAFDGWRRASFMERAMLMHRAAEVLRAHKDHFAGLMTAEMGKTLSDGRAEVEKCAVACEWYAEHARRLLADEPADLSGLKTVVVGAGVKAQDRAE